MKKKILYVDMDRTACNFDKKLFELNPAVEGLSYEEGYDQVMQIMYDNPHLFRDLEPIEGVVEAIKRLWDKYDVYFLSTPCWLLPESYTDKRLWVGDHFGDMAKDRLILSQRKDLSIGHYLVDDSRHNGAGEFIGRHIHFGHGAFPTWVEVESYLNTKHTLDTFE